MSLWAIGLKGTFSQRFFGYKGDKMQVPGGALANDLSRWRWQPTGRNDLACYENILQEALPAWRAQYPGRRPRIIVSEKWSGLAAILKEKLCSMVIVGEVKPAYMIDIIDGGEA